MAKGGQGANQVCGIENCRSRKYEEGEDGFHFKGSRAIDLYLKSLQLILRHQIWFLIRDKGLPTELETVVQDLWTVRILRFEEKLADERQEFDSSQPFPASDAEDEAGKDTLAFKSRNKKLQETPTLIDCLVLCYLGMMTLRLPITPGDIYTWTTEGKMAYRKAIKHVPAAMRDRLPNAYLSSLDPNSLLGMRRFYQSLIDIQRMFMIEHGVLWPSLNVPVLLFRYLKELALPLELYDATIRLGNILEYDFALHTESKTRIGVRHMPEAQLVACLIVCVKLFYPFDGERQHPRTNAEPAATVIDWPEWCNTMRNAENSRGKDSRYTTEELTRLREKDVFDMSGDQLDQYLDFYLENFVDESHPPNDFQQGMYDLFPVGNNTVELPVPDPHDPSAQRKWAAIRMVHSNMRPRTSNAEGDEDGDVRRPGQGYVLWNKEKHLSEHAKVFYEEAGKIVGLSMDMMVAAVFDVETRVERWKKRQRVSKKD
ncbi:hypothetical protein P280DRAFT_490742 [Massarina eburnea CBS 473.64]|uniref:RRN7-type domain-containing protein n=1 Tax=Massarina eburnea CBS 473.64 TaxID=1395130 RepID=A0A6A6RZ40_9PLEO|nr:hypothetical protein P280DRAFT_490742 [Massarina eburnea CBS 473.64]